MPFTSDLSIDVSRFDPANVSDATKQANSLLEGLTTKGPQWWEVGIQKYRQMRDEGKTPFPPSVRLAEALDATVPSREPGRDLPVRVYKPDNGQRSKGILLHIHGGGFVLATHDDFDIILQRYANQCQLTAISVGYRLAPEDPYPAAVQDCADAADYLVDHGVEEYGAPLRFISGESAGGCLSVLTAFHVMRSQPSHRLSGLILPYGEFDLSLSLPTSSSFTRPLLIDTHALERFNDAYLPGMSTAERRNPSASPLHEELAALATSTGKPLPPALFLCGTDDALLDDTLLMGTKWMIAGGEAVVKIYPGAPHGFTLFPGLPVAEEANAVAVQFVQEKLV